MQKRKEKTLEALLCNFMVVLLFLGNYHLILDFFPFRFYLSTDSSGELWISSDESESNLVKIVTLDGWTDHNQWLK